MKRFPLLIASAVLILVGAGCISKKPSAGTPSSPTQTDTKVEAPAPRTTTRSYTDAKTGISLVVPEGWTVGVDEDGDLLLTKASPYSTVGFHVFSDKAAWQKRETDFGRVQSTDVLVTKETLTIGGFPATSYTYRRDTGVDRAGQRVSFQYVEYFIDGGAKWYEISTSDPSSDIDVIIQGVRF